MATVSLEYDYEKDGARLEMWPTDVEAHSLLAQLLAPAILKNPGKESLALKGTIHYPPAHGVTKIVFQQKDVDALDLPEGVKPDYSKSAICRVPKVLEMPPEIMNAIFEPLTGRNRRGLLLDSGHIKSMFATAHKDLDDRLARILKAQEED